MDSGSSCTTNSLRVTNLTKHPGVSEFGTPTISTSGPENASAARNASLGSTAGQARPNDRGFDGTGSTTPLAPIQEKRVRDPENGQIWSGFIGADGWSSAMNMGAPIVVVRGQIAIAWAGILSHDLTFGRSGKSSKDDILTCTGAIATT
jgi:hypothetical protein